MLELVIGPSARRSRISEADLTGDHPEADDGALLLQPSAQQGTISFVTNTFGSQPVINQTINRVISIDEVANVIHTRIVLNNQDVIRHSATSAAGRRQAADMVTSRGPWVWSTYVL